VRVGDDEFHTGEPVVLQAREEAGPEHLVLAVAHVDTEDLTVRSAVAPIAITTVRETT
jgi:hypothetical protein